MQLLRYLFAKSHFRRYSSAPPATKNVLEHLKERALLRISGPSLIDYLQGLVTNDVQHLQRGNSCMYTLFLNTKGRVLYDSIVYHIHAPENGNDINTLLIECDVQGIETLQKHLKMYRVRRKIDIVSLVDDMKLYALYNPNAVQSFEDSNAVSKLSDGFIVPCTLLKTTSPQDFHRTYKGVSIFQDPRVANLGLRILTPSNFKIEDICNELNADLSTSNDKNFRWLRYNLGVGEGIADMPLGNCFPLEANCDYMHGVSFHKGCYVGQELTARTHHTGVIRKRLMPLYFSKVPQRLPTENSIVNEGNNLGKLRGIAGNVGLALLRISKALEVEKIDVGDGVAFTRKPAWWPLELPKDRITVASKTKT